jgi:hypothetical protein
MELYKFINENKIQKYKGGFIVFDNRIYTNPTEETVRKAGYKELAEVSPPEIDDNTEYLMTTYTDGDVISVTHTIKEVPNNIDEEII